MTAEEIDFEAIAVAALKDSGPMLELVDENMIGTRLPRGWAAGIKAIRLTRIGGLPTDELTAHLKRGRIQIDGFAGSGPEAFAIVARAVTVLRDLPNNYDPVEVGAVLTAVRQDLGISNQGDNDSDSERYVAGVVLYGHALPEVASGS